MDQARDDLVEMLSRDELLGDSTFSYALALRALCLVDPGPGPGTQCVVKRLADRLALHAARDERGNILFWGTQLPSQRAPRAGALDGSAVHTAHAMLALVEASPGDDLARWRATSEWLLAHPWKDTEERIIRPFEGGRFDQLMVNHFAAPWVVSSLLRVGVDAHHPRIREAVRALADASEGGLWSWGATRFPIWATHDAFMALAEYAARGAEI